MIGLQQRVNELGQWFHNIDLGGVQTAPDHFLGDYPSCKWEHIKAGIPDDLSGRSVLDIGCNGGFYSLEMKKRGASRVVGIDSDLRYLKQARFAAEVLGLQIEFFQMDVYHIAQLQEQFDLVFFMGVMYHLRYPLLALDLLRQHVVKDTLIFQSLMRGCDDSAVLEHDYPFSELEVFNCPGYPLMHFVEHRYAGDSTNWWIPNRACVEAMLRSSGFEVVQQPENEVYICRRSQPNG